MYDFWFTLGRAIMRIDLLDVIEKTAHFERLRERDIIETDMHGARKTLTNTVSAGLLQPDPTTAVRKAIRKYYVDHHVAGAPPVSIFTAGRFSQLLQVPAIGFRKNVELAGQSYRNALQGHSERFTNGFVAFLGLCLVDSIITTEFANPSDPDLLDAIQEFGIDPLELPNIVRYIGDEPFQKAQSDLLNGSGWPCGCLEQFRFWKGKNEHAILS